jgi:hypothetical protein
MKDDVAIMLNKNHSNIDKTAKKIIESLCTDSELIFEKHRYLKDSSSVFLVFERFFVKINGCISLSILLSQYDNSCYADVIISGGCVGISTMSYGTNSTYKKQAVELLQKLGFSLI